jgi:hypothetical protein
MKVSTYQANAQLLREAQRVLHQQYLESMKQLNMQVDYRKKVEHIKAQWVNPTSVDVYV